MSCSRQLNTMVSRTTGSCVSVDEASRSLAKPLEGMAAARLAAIAGAAIEADGLGAIFWDARAGLEEVAEADAANQHLGLAGALVERGRRVCVHRDTDAL